MNEKSSQQSNKEATRMILNLEKNHMIVNDMQVYLSKPLSSTAPVRGGLNITSGTSIPCPENQARNQVHISQSSSCAIASNVP